MIAIVLSSCQIGHAGLSPAAYTRVATVCRDLSLTYYSRATVLAGAIGGRWAQVAAVGVSAVGLAALRCICVYAAARRALAEREQKAASRRFRLVTAESPGVLAAGCKS